MDFIKNMWNKVAVLWQYFGVLGKARTLTATFPGTADQQKLRLWTIEQADAFGPVVAGTANTIDDKVVEWIKRIALKEKAFAAIYSLITLGCELIPKSDPVFGNAVGDVVTEAIDGEDVEPGDILTIIAAIGLLIQVVRLLRERNAGT